MRCFHCKQFQGFIKWKCPHERELFINCLCFLSLTWANLQIQSWHISKISMLKPMHKLPNCNVFVFRWPMILFCNHSRKHSKRLSHKRMKRMNFGIMHWSSFEENHSARNFKWKIGYISQHWGDLVVPMGWRQWGRSMACFSCHVVFEGR